MTNENLETYLEETPDHITMQRTIAKRPIMIELTKKDKFEINYGLPEGIGPLFIFYFNGNFQIKHNYLKDRHSTRSNILGTKTQTVQEAEKVAEVYLIERISKKQFYELKGNKHNRNSGWLSRYRSS